nr:unnamed protein product [Digitaria exilis]
METLASSSTDLSSTEGKGRRRKARKLAGGQGETEGKGRRRKIRKLAGGQGETEGKGRRRKARKLAGGRACEERAMGAGEAQAQHPSVYLTVNRGLWFTSTCGCFPLHKVEISSDALSSSRGAHVASLVASMKTDIGFKSFVSVGSRWIVGVGGNPGRTFFFDTKTGELIAGPNLVTPKLYPVVTAVGFRVYALSVTAQFEEGPDFTPWFEVLDLSKAMAVEGNLSLLDHCSWEAMPPPPFFACKLPTAEDYVMQPPIITVVSYVVVEHYIVLSVKTTMEHGYLCI